jgi:hypothetical protein
LVSIAVVWWQVTMEHLIICFILMAAAVVIHLVADSEQRTAPDALP